jgi:hypothetical protein
MRWLVLVAVAFLFAGCATHPAPTAQGVACSGITRAADSARVVVTVYAEAPAPFAGTNLTVWAAKGSDPWVEYASGRTDSHGCVDFASNGPGEYRFYVETHDGCDTTGSATANWNGLGHIDVDLRADLPCS